MGGNRTITCNSQNICGEHGVYGIVGTPAPGNIPWASLSPQSRFSMNWKNALMSRSQRSGCSDLIGSKKDDTISFSTRKGDDP